MSGIGRYVDEYVFMIVILKRKRHHFSDWDSKYHERFSISIVLILVKFFDNWHNIKCLFSGQIDVSLTYRSFENA